MVLSLGKCYDKSFMWKNRNESARESPNEHQSEMDISPEKNNTNCSTTQYQCQEKVPKKNSTDVRSMREYIRKQQRTKMYERLNVDL